MTKENKRNLYISIGLMFLFVLFTILVQAVDVQPIGPEGSEVGFATLNGAVNGFFPGNNLFYDFTELIGYVVMATALGWGILGLYQLIKRKSFNKVDYRLYLLAGFYFITVLCYVFFEVVTINYRPVLENGALAASYPSSHTMITLCFVGYSLLTLHELKINKVLNITLDIIGVILMVCMIGGRLVSGVHWTTDILGSMLISLWLISSYYTLLKWNKKNN